MDQSDFSLAEGIFIKDSPQTQDYCKGELGFALHAFMNMGFEDFNDKKFSQITRRSLLTKMVRYYQLHLMVFGDLKSPAVLHEIFTD